MAKKKAVKTNKKTSRVRRTVLGTLSGIFMASALIVAAIPVKDVEAVEENSQFTDAYNADPDRWIPEYVTSNAPVFYSSDALFGVAYANREGSPEMEGVLVYYDSDNFQAPSNLVIPDSVAAFQYDDNMQLRAVYEDGKYLYFVSKEAVVDVSGNELEAEEISPCLSTNMGEWQGKTLYSSQDGVVKDRVQTQIVANVRYIGSTKYVPNVDLSQGVVIGAYDATGLGVFEGARNFSALTIPNHILAIGNNAFKDCQMKSVTIANKIHSIGNHAFDGCNQLASVTLENETNLEEIGAYAFADCTYLTNINIPNQVQQIGSGCFMNCSNLSAANLYGSQGDGNTSLKYIGDGAFYNCISLTQMSLPNRLENIDTVNYLFYDCVYLNYLGMPLLPGGSNKTGDTSDKTFNYNNVTGCSGLMTVSVPNRELKFDCNCPSGDYLEGDGDRCAFGWKNLGLHTPFPDEYRVDDKFCIMGYRNSEAYKYVCDHEYAIGYLDEGYKGQFERVKGNYFYCVNEQNELIKFSVAKQGADTSIVDIPDNIGTHYINAIGSNTFQNNEDIEYVHIPASVTSIADSAFKGCRNLSEVEFADAMSIEHMGVESFKTLAEDDNVTLRFVGAIGPDSEPYNYAMTPKNNYNDVTLPTKYISYTSEFPTNLQVELRVVRDEVTNEITSFTPTLVAAPTFEQFADGDYSLSSYDKQAEEQNAVVRRAYTKYRSQTVSGNDAVVFSEDEQAVLDAVLKATIPTGVYGMESDIYQGRDYLKSVVLNTITDVPDGAFADCNALETFIMRSSEQPSGERIGARVFENDNQLVTVILPNTLNEMDDLPFYNCTTLESVDFSGSPKFRCDNAIIYKTKEDGTDRVVECLQTRGITVGTGKVRAEEMANVSEIADAAFQNCGGISQVYFGEAPLEAIPDYCFSDCVRLNYCEVSDFTKSIGEYAFHNTALSDIRIPSSVQLIPESAFTTDESGVDEMLKGLNIQCEVPSAAYEFAKKYGFGTEDRILPKYTVVFYDREGTVELSRQLVEEGSDAVPPEADKIPIIDGMVFSKWLPAYTDVTSDLSIYAQYEYLDPNEDANKPHYTVTFYNHDGSMKISIQSVVEGGSARAPETTPQKDGYTFIGWLPEYDNITSDLDVYPQYKEGVEPETDNKPDDENKPTDDTNKPTDDANKPQDGTNQENNGQNNNNNPTVTPENGTNNNTNNNTNKPNGSGGTNGSVSNNGSGGNNGSNSGNKYNPGTIVSVDKTGLSNTNLVSATVKGSTDDYVVKITDSESARSAVEQALLKEYGNLDDIRYFAMDISLYDKTGTTKIQNTDGISVTITMPLPDAMRSYAGNNKVGAVSGNNDLEKLQAKFTTIDGVPCISFVATHFSPYTIYVDLNNMSATGTIDATPVTGDPIHPKWFLSIGLALMSIIMFFAKGSKKRVVRVIPG